MSSKIKVAIATIRRACSTRAKDLEQSHNRDSDVLKECDLIDAELGTAAPAATGTVTTSKTAPTPKPTGAQLLAQYRSLSGEARQKFFDVHQNEIWEAHRIERSNT